MSRVDNIHRYRDYPADWLRGHGAHAARLAVLHERDGRPDMAADYLADSACWFEMAAGQDAEHDAAAVS